MPGSCLCQRLRVAAKSERAVSAVPATARPPCAGAVLLHSLSNAAYLRRLALPLGAAPALLALAPRPGLLLVHSSTDLALHLYTVNCRHLASAGGCCQGWARRATGAAAATGRCPRRCGPPGTITCSFCPSHTPIHRRHA